MRRTKRAMAVAVCLMLLAGLPTAADDGCQQASSPAYDSHECKVARLRARSFAVVAVVDSGINPYHDDFRLPPGDDRVGVHPSEYIDGFPADAPRMALTFDAPDVAAAYGRDREQWSMADERLSWPDGTNVAGIIGAEEDVEIVPGWVDGTDGQPDPFDHYGHGTQVASLAGGRLHGPGSDDIVLVAVQGASPHALGWAAAQPWIDMITNSWRNLGFEGNAEASYTAVAAGKIVCFASGNEPVPAWYQDSQGPSWNVIVGAADVRTREVTDYSGWPADVVGLTNVPAASNKSFSSSVRFGGTSAATPQVCGLMARAIAQLRSGAGDKVEGPHADRALVAGPAGRGALSDGRVTRVEIEDGFQAAAMPLGDSSVRHVRAGYGLVERATYGPAVAVLTGDAPRPTRPVEDEWHAQSNAARDAVYGPPP